MIPAKLPIDSFVEQRTFPGLPTVSVTHTPYGGTPTAPATALSRVEMVWKKLGSGAPETFTLTSAGEAPGILITSAANWAFNIPAAILPLATAGRWEWLITCYGVDATVAHPYLTGVVTVQAAP